MFPGLPSMISSKFFGIEILIPIPIIEKKELDSINLFSFKMPQAFLSSTYMSFGHLMDIFFFSVRED